MTNSQGGSLILGVRDNDDGKPDVNQDVATPHERVEAVTNVIYDRVEPNLDSTLARPRLVGRLWSGSPLINQIPKRYYSGVITNEQDTYIYQDDRSDVSSWVLS